MQQDELLKAVSKYTATAVLAGCDAKLTHEPFRTSEIAREVGVWHQIVWDWRGVASAGGDDLRAAGRGRAAAEG